MIKIVHFMVDIYTLSMTEFEFSVFTLHSLTYLQYHFLLFQKAWDDLLVQKPVG